MASQHPYVARPLPPAKQQSSSSRPKTGRRQIKRLNEFLCKEASCQPARIGPCSKAYHFASCIQLSHQCA